MNITCPSCATRYLVDPTALGETGRMVRCARCSHTWMETPPEDTREPLDLTVAPEAPRPIPPGSNLPALHRETRSRGWVGWAALLVVLLAVAGGGVVARDRVVEVWPPATRIYALIGLAEPEPAVAFELRGVKQTSFVENEQTIVLVSGTIANISGRTRTVPKVDVQIVDARDRVLDEWRFDAEGSELAPGESTDFRHRLTDPPKDAANLVVRLHGGD